MKYRKKSLKSPHTRNSKYLIQHLGDSGYIYQFFVKSHQMNIPKFDLNWLSSFGAKDQNVKTLQTMLK